MFNHVLIPTDGSPLSRKAVKAGIAFAKQFGAKVTVYHAIEFVPPYADGGFVPPSVLEQFEAGARKQAQKYLEEATKVGQAAAVPCESQISRPGTVYQGIVDAAKKKKCDVIFMASHGRGELASLVLGSVTLKVLAHSKIPVVVFR
jgi:nucleotide-binding universal stress UspA family protein